MEDPLDVQERDAKARISAELKALEETLDLFLSGEVRDELITPFKVTLMVHARTLVSGGGQRPCGSGRGAYPRYARD